MNLDPDLHKLLSDYAKKTHIDMTMILAMFIESGVKHDIYDPDWEDKRAAAERVTAAYAGTEGGCHKLAMGKRTKGSGKNKITEEVFSCVSYNELGVVKVKNLGAQSLKDGKCYACGQDRDFKAGIQFKDNRISELEKGLKTRASELYKIPVCEGGAHLSVEGTSFERCRRSNISVDVLRFCKVVDDGPCAYFKEKIIGVGTKR